MRIYIDRYFSFYTGGNQPWVEVELLNPERLDKILSRLGIPLGEVHLAVINGQAADPVSVIATDKDEIRIYPAFGGG